MTRLILSARFAADLDRVHAHLRQQRSSNIDGRLAEIVDALELLTRHPLIGRRVESGRRELVIGRGSRGYVALYVHDAIDDVVAVLALRSQREAGYADT